MTDIQDYVVSGDGFNKCKRCRYGLMLYNINDQHIGRSLDLYGEWAESEMALLRPLIEPGDVIVDVGANIGTHVLFFAKMIGRLGRVLAFEPQRVVFQTLCANVALNSYQNVVALPAVAADRRTVISVPIFDYSKEKNYGGIRMGGEAPGELVSTAVIDDFNLPKCRLMKIDVEGMEPFVLDGSIKTIMRCKPIIYIENNTTQGSKAIISRLLEAGYDLYWHFSPFFNPDNYFKNPENIFGNTCDSNMLCVPKGANVNVSNMTPVSGVTDTAIDAAKRGTTGTGIDHVAPLAMKQICIGKFENRASSHTISSMHEQQCGRHVERSNSIRPT